MVPLNTIFRESASRLNRLVFCYFAWQATTRAEPSFMTLSAGAASYSQIAYRVSFAIRTPWKPTHFGMPKSRVWQRAFFPEALRRVLLLKAAANFTCQLLMPTCRELLHLPTSHANLSRVTSPANFSCQLVESYFTCLLLMSTF